MAGVGRSVIGGIKSVFSGGDGDSDQEVRSKGYKGLNKRAASITEQIRTNQELSTEEKQKQLAEFDKTFKGVQAGIGKASGYAGGLTIDKEMQEIKAFEASLTKTLEARKKKNQITRSVVKEQFDTMKKGVNAKLNTNQINSFLGSVNAKNLALKDNRGSGSSVS
jgi:hypothetical protein